MKFGVGQAVTRKEDVRFLRGTGRYVDDVTLPGQAYGVFVRSPVAHARILGVACGAARTMPGVLGVWTNGEGGMEALADARTGMGVRNADGSDGAYPAQPHLARDTVRHVGQPVAFVVAESEAAARAAAETVTVEYDEMPAVIGSAAALEPDAPCLHTDAPGNLAYDWEVGDAAAVEAAFAKAAHVSRLRIDNPRIVVNTMEPRAINAAHDGARWEVWCGTQGSHAMRAQIAAALQVEPERLRLRTPDVGGGFGMKLMLHPEYAVVCKAAELLGRPVKWTADRSESFLSDLQGRDIVTEAEAACDADGRILAMRLSSVSDLGAYPSRAAPACHTTFCGDLAPTVYAIGAVHNRVRGVYTNTTPMDAYRGAGRPEQNYIMERVIDRVGADMGIAQDAIRRRNLATPDMMPWTTALGVTFDSGDFPRVLDAAMERADFAGYEARRREAARRGRLGGIGLVCYMERTAGGPVEQARVQLIPGRDGAPNVARIWSGTQSTGQGHETAFAQIVRERLGIDFDAIEWVPGDSDALPAGGGTGGSRSLLMAGRSFLHATEDVIAKARAGAAEALEAAEADIEFHAVEGGEFRIAGTDRTVDLFTAVAAMPLGEARAGDAVGLIGEGGVNGRENTYPNGCHICEVEIDPETGDVAVTRYTVVDDFGTLVNPLLVLGQVQGGVAQGIGEALCEQAIYDPGTGQPLTGSYMDYVMPKADDLPMMDISFAPTPCTTNELGIKGCGEAGTVGAGSAVICAALDALRPVGVTEIDMPLSPLKVWSAIRGASARMAAE